jgi:3-oxoadipate enol-lactonase
MLADDAKALVDSLGITDFHLMGVSMGGMIAQEYALAYGRDLRSATSRAPTRPRAVLLPDVRHVGGMAPVLGIPYVMRDVTCGLHRPFFEQRR